MTVITEKASSTEQSTFAFYRELDSKGRRTFWACFGGYALDAMDFMTYPLLIGTLLVAFKMDRTTAGAIATAALLSGAIGGWCAGYLADRIGRIRTMQITIALFSFGSLLSAFAQDASQLMFCRAILGFGFGGEAAVAAVTVAEIVSAKNRGNAIGFHLSSYAVGWAIAVIAQAILFASLTGDIAWRAMFALGVLPAMLVFFVRRNVSEPTISVAARKSEAPAAFAQIFFGGNLVATVKGALLAVGVQGGFYALLTWLPQFLQAERKLPLLGSLTYLTSVIIGHFFGLVIGGWLADRAGRRASLFVFAMVSAITLYAYTQLPLSSAQLFLLGFPLGFCPGGLYPALMSCLNESFPTLCRGQGVGFCYSFGRAVGGTFPLLVGAAATTFSLGTAISLFAIGSYVLIAVVAIAMKETKGVALSTE